MSKNHWIIRVGDGENFYRSKNPFWGVIRHWKPKVKKMKPGDILWFLTNKDYGGQIIAMAEYTGFYDRRDEPLLSIHTCTNEEQNWIGDKPWDIQIHYTNVYDTKNKTFLQLVIHCQSSIIDYKESCQIPLDLDLHYKNFILYAEPKKS